MNLLIDIRTEKLADIHHIEYALAWATIYRARHPEASIEYLAYEGDEAIVPTGTITLSRKWSLFPPHQALRKWYQFDAILQFSPLAPLFPKTPTLTHIYDAASFLYPREQMGYFARRNEEKVYQKALQESRAVIVPHTSVWLELMEIFGAEESKLHVIPYFIPEVSHQERENILQKYNIMPWYWVTEGSSGNEWNPLWLLHAFARYRKEKGGTKKLLIFGDIGELLTPVSSYIRDLDLIDTVKLMGTLPHTDHRSLYAHSDGWIYLGGYYSGGSTFALMKQYKKPLLVADIPLLRDYSYHRIHPNHLDEMPERLKKFELDPYDELGIIYDNNAIFDVYDRVLHALTHP